MVVRIDDEEGALVASFDGRAVSYPADETPLDQAAGVAGSSLRGSG